MHRLGVVSFLNSRPLIEGLSDDPRVSLLFDVPSRLAERLRHGEVDAALVPIVDVLREASRLRVVSDACIACDGPSLTVRVFSQVPPDRIHTLHVDRDSHTSKALATVLWRELYGRTLEVAPLNAAVTDVQAYESVLLIGDKVVRNRAGHGFAYEMDLGGAWRQWTGLPFVFAVWAEMNPSPPHGATLPSKPPGGGAADAVDGATPSAGAAHASLSQILSTARDRGVARAREIAEEHGPPRWWPVDLAAHYLTRSLKYRLDERYIAGTERFARLCAASGMAQGAELIWPQSSRAHAVSAGC
jgi:chorismate dehydratase